MLVAGFSSSAPVFDSSGKYQGMIGGTIYLEENNILRRKDFLDKGLQVPRPSIMDLQREHFFATIIARRAYTPRLSDV